MRTSQHRAARDERLQGLRGVLRLWFGVLGGPWAWSVQLGALYAAMPHLCGAEGWALMPAVLSAAAFAVALLALYTAYRTWRATGSSHHAEGPGEIGRSRMLAQLGLGTSSFFAIVIAVQSLPLAFIDPCPLALAVREAL